MNLVELITIFTYIIRGEMEFYLNKDHRYMNLAASTDEFRPQMKGAWIDPKNNRMVITNGHILAELPVKHTADLSDEADLKPFIVPMELLQRMFKSIGRKVKKYVITKRGDELQAMECSGNTIHTAEVINKTFPQVDSLLDGTKELERDWEDGGSLRIRIDSKLLLDLSRVLDPDNSVVDVFIPFNNKPEGYLVKSMNDNCGIIYPVSYGRGIKRGTVRTQRGGWDIE